MAGTKSAPQRRGGTKDRTAGRSGSGDSERIRAELHRTREQYEHHVDSIDGIVWEADADTFRFTFVSDKAERLLGYPSSNWIDDPSFWSEHIHPEDRSW